MDAIRSIKKDSGFVFDRFYLNACNVNSDDVKITISFEVPEKKVEITESELEKIWYDMGFKTEICYSKEFQAFKNKLFGE